jgi:outer membrane receptor for ferrienterochelin and colicin
MLLAEISIHLTYPNEVYLPMNAMQRFRIILAGGLIPFFFLFVYPFNAYSEKLADEELGFMEIEDVLTASKRLQGIQDAPASITITTDEDIKKYGHRNLTDVVKNVRSFYTYSDRNYDYIGVRGFARLGDYGNRVLQLVDGHTYNDNIYGSFSMGDAFGVDMDMVKKIEFVRGPGSALYGSNALLGTVNILTKKGKEIAGLYTKAEARSHNTYAGGFIFGKEFENGVDLISSLSLLDSKGQDHYFAEFDSPPASNGWARNSDGEKAKKFFLKASYHDLSFLANIGWREKTIPTASFGTTFNDNRFKTVDARDFAEIKWEHSFDDNKRMMTRVYYDRYSFTGDYPYDYPPVTINKDEALGQWIGTELNYSHKIASSHFLIGGEVLHYMDANQKNYDVDPQVVYVDDNRSFTTWSSYLQDEMDISSYLRLIAGLRYDHYSTFGEHLSPRVGFIVKPVKESTVKLLYGQAFRAPNVYELYYQSITPSASTYKANPDLKPELLHTYEAVWEQELSTILKSTVSAFRYEIKDLITQVQNPDDASLQFQNTDRVKGNGLEMGIEMIWPDVLKGQISYTYQETKDDLTGQWLVNSPRHLVKAGVTLPIYKDTFFLGAQCRYMSQRLNRDRESVGESIVADLTVSTQNIVKGLGLSFGIYNVFDEQYSDPVSLDHMQKVIRQDGRNYRFKIDYLF